MTDKLNEQQKKLLKLDIRRELYKKSFYEFFKDAVQVIEPTTHWSFNWHFEYLCDMLQQEAERIKINGRKDKDIIVNVPFRSGKSYLFTIVFPVWFWIIHPEGKILSLSYSQDLATTHSYKSKVLMNENWFKELYPDFEFQADQNSKSHYANMRNGERIALGFGGSITGQGADIIIMDDPNHVKQVSNVNLISDQRTYNDIVYSRLNNPKVGIRIIIQQRLAEEDLSGYLLTKNPEKYRHICIPAEEAENIEPKTLKQYYEEGLFWKERFDWEVLSDYKSTLGTKAYSNQLKQKAVPDEGIIFKKDWFVIMPFDDLLDKELVWDLYIDPAYTSDKNNDPSGIVLISRPYNGKIFIKKAWEYWLEFPELIKKIQELHNNYCSSKSKIYVEPKAAGKSVVQSIRNLTTFNIMELDSTKDSKETRANAISPITESKRVVLFKDSSWNNNFIDQVTGFPVASHDDMLDCMMFAIEKQLQKKTNKLSYRFA